MANISVHSLTDGNVSRRSVDDFLAYARAYVNTDTYNGRDGSTCIIGQLGRDLRDHGRSDRPDASERGIVAAYFDLPYQAVACVYMLSADPPFSHGFERAMWMAERVLLGWGREFDTIVDACDTIRHDYATYFAPWETTR